MRYAGMLETIRIRKLGFGLRAPFASFVKQYDLLLNAQQRSLPPSEKIWNGDLSLWLGFFYIRPLFNGYVFVFQTLVVAHCLVFLN